MLRSGPGPVVLSPVWVLRLVKECSQPSDEEKEDWPVPDVSSVNLELPSNISFGDSNDNLMNEERDNKKWVLGQTITFYSTSLPNTESHHQSLNYPCNP